MSLRWILPLFVLAACGDDTSKPTDTTSTSDATTSTTPDGTDTTDTADTTPGTQAGTAAIGAAIANATVTGTCADGSHPSGTTAANGTFTLAVDEAALPCALTLTGGTTSGGANTVTLHSLATSAGVANITPLTDLALAVAVDDVVSLDLAAWAAAPTDLAAVAAALPAASDTLRAALVAAGYGLPASWTTGRAAPFTVPFIAGSGSDPYDKLLDDVAAAIDDAGSSYAATLAAIVSGSALPHAVIDPNNLPLNGDGAALAGADGATGTFEGTTYTYSAGVAWGYLPQFGVDTGSFRAYGPGANGQGFDAITGWLIGGFKAEVGTYHCKSFENDTTRIQLVVGGINHDTAPTGGGCTIEVQSISPTAVTGRFSATLINADATVSTVTDGYFYKHLDNGGGEALPEGEQGASFDLDGQTFRYVNAGSLAFEEFAGISAAPADGPGAPIGIQIHTIPNKLGTFACGSNQGNEYRGVNMWFYWDNVYYTAGNRQSPGPGPEGSSCSVTVTEVGSSSGGKYYGTFEGTFSGTFVSGTGATKVVSNGKFRLIGETYQPPEYLTALVGTYAMKVTASSFDAFHYNDDIGVTIAANGTITVGTEVFVGGQYGVDAYLQDYNREPGILATRSSDGTTVRIGVPDSQHVQYIHLEGGSKYLDAGVRPLAPAMVDALEELIAGSPYTLRLVKSQGFGTVCDSHTLTVDATTIDAMQPYLKYNAPGATDGWGESSRLSTDGDALVLTNYYSRLFFHASGAFELRSLGGSFQEFETWTNDAAAISAAGCQ